MTDEKSQKFTSKVRRGLTWVSTVSGHEESIDPPGSAKR